MRTILPLALAAAAFAAVMALGTAFGGECADLWVSRAIGEAGACSSHGGVVRDPWWVVALGGAQIAAGVFFLTAALTTRVAPPAR